MISSKKPTAENDDGLRVPRLLKLVGELRDEGGVETNEPSDRRRPELVLLDIGMPRLNGYDTARRIREQPWGKYTMLVALTGWGLEEDRQKTHDAGFDCHMVKPVDPVALKKLLATCRADTA